MRYAWLYPTETALERGRELVSQFVSVLKPDIASKLETVFGEAMANAIKANILNGGSRIMVILSYSPRAIRMIVADAGGGFDPTPHLGKQIDLWAENGRGIPLMQQETDSLKYRRSKKGMILSAAWNR